MHARRFVAYMTNRNYCKDKSSRSAQLSNACKNLNVQIMINQYCHSLCFDILGDKVLLLFDSLKIANVFDA